MKYIIIILIILPIFCFGQNFKHKKCDSGYSYMPTISTSSLIIYADTCLPDSVCKKLWIRFSKNMCGETQMTSYGGKRGMSITNTWVNDSIGCVSKEKYWKLVNKKTVYITRDEYEKLK